MKTKEKSAQIHICVGSLNPSKCEAVKNAFGVYYHTFKIYKTNVNSDVPNQPIGINDIISGAKNRAKRALEYLISNFKINQNILGVGIEAGVVPIDIAISHYMDFQFCAIIDENKNITLGSGVAFEYPQKIIDKLLSNKNLEIGTIIGQLVKNPNLKNEGGSISILSKNILTRTGILTQAVICALLPRINKEFYQN